MKSDVTIASDSEDDHQPVSTILRLENQIKSLLATSHSAVCNLEDQIVILDEQLNRGKRPSEMIANQSRIADSTPTSKRNISLCLPDPSVSCCESDQDLSPKRRIPLSGIANQGITCKFDANNEPASESLKSGSRKWNILEGLDGSDEDLHRPFRMCADLRLQLLKRESQLQTARQNCELLENRLKAERQRCRKHEADLAMRDFELEQMRRYASDHRMLS